MFNHVHEIHVVIRDIVFANIAADSRLCFSIFETTDCGPLQAGDLFEQDEPFFMVETVIDRVRKARPGPYTPRRAWGGVEISLFTKDTLDDLGNRERHDAIAGWFASQTLNGVRFREHTPLSVGRVRGFQMYPGVIPLEFDIHSKQR